FWVELGMNHVWSIDGANPNTPLSAGNNYSVRVYAFDGRNNLSLSSTRSTSVLPAAEIDTIPPHVVSAKLLDLGSRGVIDGVEVVFSEAVNTAAINATGFKLNGIAARFASIVNSTTIVLDFGSGVAGTAGAELTFDEATGSVVDLKGNHLRSFGANDVNESDASRPVIVAGSIQAIDDDGDGHADRVSVRFSEAINPSSLELADILAIRDGQGVLLNATGLSLSEDGRDLTITLDDSIGATSGLTVELADNGNGNFIADLNGNTLVAIESNLAPVITLETNPRQQTMHPGVLRLDASKTIDPDGSASALTFTWTFDSHSSALSPRFLSNNATTLTGQS
ncbi:MAG: Ig-like domain-containing protein, partial [Planctomycetes bacterium]|nr:Ig-like domain-containing protein [Planctomycetota bacterium]